MAVAGKFPIVQSCRISVWHRRQAGFPFELDDIISKLLIIPDGRVKSTGNHFRQLPKRKPPIRKMQTPETQGSLPTLSGFGFPRLHAHYLDFEQCAQRKRRSRPDCADAQSGLDLRCSQTGFAFKGTGAYVCWIRCLFIRTLCLIPISYNRLLLILHWIAVNFPLS